MPVVLPINLQILKYLTVAYCMCHNAPNTILEECPSKKRIFIRQISNNLLRLKRYKSHRFSMFEDGVLREIFMPKREERENCMTRNIKICTLYQILL